MTEPTRGTINKNVLKSIDLLIENQKEITNQFEQLIMMTQAQAVVIKDIIDDIQIIDKNLDRKFLRAYFSKRPAYRSTIFFRR